ncbi:MAG: tRNA uridine-5-carboxymethylaminomethyl(34) synthesis enzyme MnmG, partial [Nitrospinota bacterium]
RDGIKCEIVSLGKSVLKPSEDVIVNLREVGTNLINEPLTLLELLRRPEIKYDDLLKLQPSVFSLQPYGVREQVEIQVKYEGYINRELLNVERFKRLEEKGIPPEVNFENIPGLSNEVKEKLSKVRPISIGQASRISGVTPSAISILMIYLEQLKRNKLKTQSLKVF